MAGLWGGGGEGGGVVQLVIVLEKYEYLNSLQ